MNDPLQMKAMLAARTIAVIGLSDDPGKPSHYVSAYMQRAGKKIFPINPGLTSVLGEQGYSSLAELPRKPELVNVFRLPRTIPGIVDEMIQLGLTQLWVQQGIVHEEAAFRAEAHGIAVVMDRCIMVEHRFRM